MTRILFRPPNSDESPRVLTARRSVRRRPQQAAAALHVAQNYAEAGLPVIPLWPGDKRPNSPRQGNATIGAHRIRAWWTWWLTINVGVGLGRTRGGQAS